MLLGALSLAEIESSLQRPQHPNLTGKDGRIGRRLQNAAYTDADAALMLPTVMSKFGAFCARNFYFHFACINVGMPQHRHTSPATPHPSTPGALERSSFQQSDADSGIIIEDGGNCASLKSRGESFYPSARIPVPLAAGQQHYFEVELCWSGIFVERRKISFRMGICREPPRMGYLGKAQDEFSFWWDDGDIYHQGLRYRPGGLTKSHPMAIGDRVGVIVDLRHPVAPLEFVLNRKSTGPFLRHTVKHLVFEGHAP
eukprot:s2801_g3.t4